MYTPITRAGEMDGSNLVTIASGEEGTSLVEVEALSFFNGDDVDHTLSIFLTLASTGKTTQIRERLLGKQATLNISPCIVLGYGDKIEAKLEAADSPHVTWYVTFAYHS